MPEKEKQKRYHQPAVMDTPCTFLFSRGIYLALKKESNMSDYLRKLIMNDKNIDEHGKEKKSN